MALSVKVSSKYQISVPSEVRRRLGIEAGDRLSVSIRDDEIVLRRRPARASERLRGLGKGLFGDPVEYLRRLHEEWEDEVRERERRWGGEHAEVGDRAVAGAPARPPTGCARRKRVDRPPGGRGAAG